MASIYTTRQGETVDLVCMAFYGRTAQVTETVLAANPGLAGLGPILPMGTQISLPDIAKRKTVKPLIKLYE